MVEEKKKLSYYQKNKKHYQKGGKYCLLYTSDAADE